MIGEIFSESLPPTTVSTVTSRDGRDWSDPDRIKVDDDSSATLYYITGGDNGAVISGSGFNFRKLPIAAKILGLAVQIKGSQSGMYNSNSYVYLNIPDTETQEIDTLNKTYGGLDYFWGLDGLTASDLEDLEVSVTTQDTSGGDSNASIDYMAVTVFWKIEMPNTETPGLQTDFIYRVYNSNNSFIGTLPNVISEFSFTQDINSAGSSLKTVCATSPLPASTSEAILDESSNPIQTESSLDILADLTVYPLLQGASETDALFKNGNRLKVWMFNKWYPNGKIMFSGQINRLDFSLGGEEQITVTSYSDGMDLDNFIARGYPFDYTTDQSQIVQNGYLTLSGYDTPFDFKAYGQSFTTGSSVNNIGEIKLLVEGTAPVRISVYDAPNNGNLLGTIIQQIVGATVSAATAFRFKNLISVDSSTEYFFSVNVESSDYTKSIKLYKNSAGGYANGSAYEMNYPLPFSPRSDDLYFVTASGEPTTTTTYSTSDPVTGMAKDILTDYNNQGGIITARNLTAAGYDLTYTFNSATIFSALQNILAMAPDGYFAYVDLGDSTIDIGPVSEDADYIVVIGRDISTANLALTIEQVKNTLLFSGGDTGGGNNLFKKYQDTSSADNFGIRIEQKSDNRVTLDDTADAIGESFKEENSSEGQESQISILNEKVDITQFTPGKVIGFRNTGIFLNDILVQIVRREFNKDIVSLTLGLLPITQNAQIQRINRGLLNEQTINNPNQPS